MDDRKMDDTEQRKKAIEIDLVLQEAYGAPFIPFSYRDPLSEMVSALLSHRTKNAITKVAYMALKDRYPDWESVIGADTVGLEAVIAAVTFPEVKAPRIQKALSEVKRRHGKFSLSFLADMSVEDARAWLEEIPGVGAKTSAAVLSFSELRMPALVVDTHHHRVAQRLGIVPPKATLDKTARLLQSYLPEDWDGQKVYDSHQGFMRHGQRVCVWRSPHCSQCIIRDKCDFYVAQK